MSSPARSFGVRRIAATGVVGFVGLVGLAACGGSKEPERVSWAAASPVAPWVIDSETVLYAERLTGRVMRIDLDRPGSEPRLIGEVEVDAAGEQRGLIGLAVIGDTVYGTWTRPGDLRVIVGEIEKEQRIVWEGPVSPTKAIGGHLDVLDGRLVIGLGELVEDPDVAGKMLSLDPAGPPDQTPVELSAGWNNPFAFVIVDGEVIVADNAPDGGAERLDGEEFPETAQRAPSAIVVTGNGRFGVCGYLDGEMRGYTIGEDDGVVERSGTIIDSGCQTGAVALPDGTFVITDDTAVRHIKP
jgi:hypothetical protein